MQARKPRLTPLHAHGVFHVCLRGGVGEYIVFHYRDNDGYYEKLFLEGFNELMDERKILKENMQVFLEEEEVYFNGRKTTPIVEDVDISLPCRKEVDFIFIIWFRAFLRPGKNIYENIYEETIAEYDYNVIWRFPPGSRNIWGDVSVPVEVRNNILFFKVKKGVRIGGYEKIGFDL